MTRKRQNNWNGENIIDINNEEVIIRKKKEIVDINDGRDMSPNEKREVQKSNYDKQNYHKTITECNKLRSSIKHLSGRKITIL